MLSKLVKVTCLVKVRACSKKEFNKALKNCKKDFKYTAYTISEDNKEMSSYKVVKVK